jgi:hypothetical protein
LRLHLIAATYQQKKNANGKKHLLHPIKVNISNHLKKDSFGNAQIGNWLDRDIKMLFIKDSFIKKGKPAQE